MRLSKRQALLALCVTAPITTIGATMSLRVAPGAVGTTVMVIGQLWLLAFPVIWLVRVEKRPIRISKPNARDEIHGLVVGLLMFGIIMAAYGLLLRHWIDLEDLRLKVQQITSLDRRQYQLGGVYFIFVNALIEEYFWRWFIYRQCEVLFTAKVAVPLSAFLFMAHHTVGLAVFIDIKVTIVGSLGVLGAGIVWSEIYRRSRRIWSDYVSHAIADVALHIVAWQLLFGSIA